MQVLLSYFFNFSFKTAPIVTLQTGSTYFAKSVFVSFIFNYSD